MAKWLDGAKKAVQDSKTRIFLIILAVIIIAGLIIAAFHIFDDNNEQGRARLTGIPGSIQSVPGSQEKQNQQYLQTLLQSNQQQAQQALKSGRTEIPTMVASQAKSSSQNLTAQSEPQQQACPSCACLKQCEQQGDQNDAGGVIGKLEADGKVSPALAGQLKQLQAEGMTPEQYQKKLEQLVKEGKLTPAEARQLEASYNKKHGVESPDSVVNGLEKSGSISAATANQLKKLNGENLSPESYAEKLAQLVKEGKLSPAQAKKLMASYDKKQGVSSGNSTVNGLLSSGGISPQTAKQLKALNNQNLSPADYAKKLKQLVKEGKLSPAAAKKLLDAYNKSKGADAQDSSGGNGVSPDGLVDQLKSSGGITAQTANDLKNLNGQNLTPQEYANKLAQMVKEGKLTPAQAKQLLASYNNAHGSQEKTPDSITQSLAKSGAISPATASKLEQLNNEGLSPQDYANKLQQMVKDGDLSPQQAQRLLKAYRAKHAGGSADSGDLDKLLQQQEQAVQSEGQKQQLKQQQQNQELAEEPGELQEDQQDQQQQQEQALQSAISGQAKELISAWSAPKQTVSGSFGPPAPSNSGQKGEATEGLANAGSNNTTSSDSGGQQNSNAESQSGSTKGTIAQAGDIMFAVLDTAINSDQPGPVMATIVSGKLKGTKLLGSLQVTPDYEGVILSFNEMSNPKWSKSVSINAVAIDPNTARTALAGNVNHHYLLRFSSLFASSFMDGIGQAVQKSGQTSVNNSGTSTQTFSDLNASDKVLIGLGQVGKAMGDAAKKEFNRNPTVTVNSGAGIGILYTKDVPTPSFLAGKGNQQSESTEEQS